MRPDNTSLEASRGIESVDINICLTLVKASVEEVAQTLRQLKPWDVWIPDAYGRFVEANQGTLVFKFRGHSWSYIYQPFVLTNPMGISESDALAISDLLSTAVIDYAASDTGGWSRYCFYLQGSLVEKLRFEESDTGGDLEFQSQRCEMTARDIQDDYRFTLNFLHEQDAYIPALFVDRQNVSVESGQLVDLQIENLMPNELERLDYLYKTP